MQKVYTSGECTICMETFTSGIVLCCGHVFCPDCPKKLIEQLNLTCPICRKDINIPNNTPNESNHVPNNTLLSSLGYMEALRNLSVSNASNSGIPLVSNRWLSDYWQENNNIISSTTNSSSKSQGNLVITGGLGISSRNIGHSRAKSRERYRKVSRERKSPIRKRSKRRSKRRS
jgi:hypothetical protein